MREAASTAISCSDATGMDMVGPPRARTQNVEFQGQQW